MQQDTILQVMYDAFEARKYVNYAKVRDFAVLVQKDADLCELCGAEPVDEAWEPSDAWIAGYLKRWGITSHKATGKASSRSRPTMEAEKAWVDANFAKFDAARVVTQDESSFIWGSPPYRTLATRDGLGAQLTTEDKWEKTRSTLVLAVRSTENSDEQILTPLVIPSHDCAPARRSAASQQLAAPGAWCLGLPVLACSRAYASLPCL